MKFDQDLCMNLWHDLKKKNSTLVSIVPLAMFEMKPEKETLCIGKGTSDSNKKELSSPSVLQVFSWYENQISLKKKYYF